MTTNKIPIDITVKNFNPFKKRVKCVDCNTKLDLVMRKGFSYNHHNKRCPSCYDNFYINKGCEAGYCPHCNSGNINHGVIELNENEAHYPIYCQDCGKTSKEFYYLIYNETIGD